MASCVFASSALGSAVGRPRPNTQRSHRLQRQLTVTPRAAASSAPVTWSLSSYDEVSEEKYKCELLNQCNIGMAPTTPVREVMSKELTCASPRSTIKEVEEMFAKRPISGMPVTKDGVLVGVVSRKDLRTTFDHGVTHVADIMSTPAICIQPSNTLQDAALLMLKYKIHRLPVVNDQKHVIGMITRTDLFSALGIFGAEARASH